MREGEYGSFLICCFFSRRRPDKGIPRGLRLKLVFSRLFCKLGRGGGPTTGPGRPPPPPATLAGGGGGGSGPPALGCGVAIPAQNGGSVTPPRDVRPASQDPPCQRLCALQMIDLSQMLPSGSVISHFVLGTRLLFCEIDLWEGPSQRPEQPPPPPSPPGGRGGGGSGPPPPGGGGGIPGREEPGGGRGGESRGARYI